MRFSLATVVLSLAAMAAAAPTDVLISRNTPSAACSVVGGNVQCCLTSTTSPGGLLGSLPLLNGLLQCSPLQGILGVTLNGGACNPNQQAVCCNNNLSQSGFLNVNTGGLLLANNCGPTPILGN